MTAATMNTSNIILSECPSPRLLWSNCCPGRVLRTVVAIIGIAFVSLLSSAAWGANPAEELAKAGATGGVLSQSQLLGGVPTNNQTIRHSGINSSPCLLP